MCLLDLVWTHFPEVIGFKIKYEHRLIQNKLKAGLSVNTFFFQNKLKVGFSVNTSFPYGI